MTMNEKGILKRGSGVEGKIDELVNDKASRPSDCEQQRDRQCQDAPLPTPAVEKSTQDSPSPQRPFGGGPRLLNSVSNVDSLGCLPPYFNGILQQQWY